MPNRGVRVLALDRDESSQAFLARAAPEGIAADLAAAQIMSGDLGAVETVNTDFIRQTAVFRDAGLYPKEREMAALAWVVGNERLHAPILRAAHPPLHDRLIASVHRVLSGVALWSPGSATDRLYEANIQQHDAIRHVPDAKNPQAARILVHDHILNSRRLPQAVLDEASPETVSGRCLPPSGDG